MCSWSTWMPMTRKHFFGIILIFQTVFNFIPYNKNAPTYELFLFSSQHMTEVQWVYFTFEHISIIYLCLLLVWDSSYRIDKKGMYFNQVFAALTFLDFVDFICFANAPYTIVGGFPISYNILQAITYVVFCYFEPKDDG